VDETHPVLSRDESRRVARTNWIRAGVKLVPYIGDALDELIYGRIDDARWQRFERTLSELAELMKQRQIPPSEVNREAFGELLEIVAPAASHATTDEKRRLLRDLLLNAVTLPEGHTEWESARLAARLIAGLEVPEIAILVGLDKIGARGNSHAELRAVGPSSCELALTERVGASVPLPFKWLVIDQAYRRVSSAPARLVISGPGAVKRYTHLALTELGEFVVDWARAGQVDADSSHGERAV
jgi:hypothetical protein